MRLACSLLFIAIAHAAEPPNLRQLLQDAQAATREQLRLSARYLGKEDIHEYEVKPSGKKTMHRWSTYEASVLEGMPYYRLIAINGKPLSKAQEAIQEGQMARELEYRRRTAISERRNKSRYSANMQHIIDYHELSFVGEEPMAGRPTWVIDTKLRDSAPRPEKHEDLMLSGNTRLWIDQASGVILSWRLTIHRPWHAWTEGSTDQKITQVIESPDGKPIFVAKEMSARAPLPNGAARLTVQTFSDYRRFEADSLITFEP